MSDGAASPAAGYLLVDGENVDGQLWEIFRGQPQRPRWERVKQQVEARFGGPLRALFFINTTNKVPWPFVRALEEVGYAPILLKSSHPDQKVVDEAIKKTFVALRQRPGYVVLGSHDADFVPDVEWILTNGGTAGILALTERVAGSLLDLEARGLQIIDLEDDADAFNVRLPRVRPVTVEDYNPDLFL